MFVSLNSNFLTWNFRWTSACLLCWLLTSKVWGQETSAASPLHLVIKAQAYSPLTWLAEQAHQDLRFPFTPRFWTGEAEFGLSDRRSVQASLGILRWRLDEVWPSGAHPIDTRDGLRLTLAYRDYYQSSRRGPLSGPYYSPFLRWVNQARSFENLIGEHPSGVITTNAVSGGIFGGWQTHVGKHLYLDFGIGLEIGYQWYHMTEGADRVEVSTFDYAGAKLWRGEGDRNRSFAGIGLTTSIGIGWLLF